MARPKTNQPVSTVDAIREAAEKLKRQAIEPNIDGYRPHAKQELFHKSQSRIKLYIGGNRSGKTVGGITEDLFWLRGKHPFRRTPDAPVRGRIVSTDFTNGMEKIIIPNLLRFTPISELRGGSWYSAYDNQTHILNFQNGSFVELMSYEQDLEKFSGTSRHFIHFDEEPPQDIYGECRARLVDTGGSLWITMTPVEGMTWVFDDLYEPGIDNKLGAVEIIEIDMTENPYISPAEIDFLSSGMDEEEVNARVHGRFVEIAGKVYPMFSKDTHVINPVEIPTHWQIHASMDHGLTNPTAWLWHAVDPDSGRVITFHEHYKDGWTIDKHAKTVLEYSAAFGRPPITYTGDPSIVGRNPVTGTSVYEEYIKFGIPILLGNNDIDSGVIRVRRYLNTILPDGKPMWLVTSDCEKLIWELGRLAWDRYTNKKTAHRHNKKEKPQKKNDHACDSLRYFIMSRPELHIPEWEDSKPNENPLNLVAASVGEQTVSDWVSADLPKEYGEWSEYATKWTTDELGTDW